LKPGELNPDHVIGQAEAVNAPSGSVTGPFPASSSLFRAFRFSQPRFRIAPANAVRAGKF
jgi:hypothetical protein